MTAALAMRASPGGCDSSSLLVEEYICDFFRQRLGAGEVGEGYMQVLVIVGKTMYFTSQNRKDLVVMKVAMLGRSSCRPAGETSQKVSPVQKFGWCTFVVTALTL